MHGLRAGADGAVPWVLQDGGSGGGAHADDLEHMIGDEIAGYVIAGAEHHSCLPARSLCRVSASEDVFSPDHGR